MVWRYRTWTRRPSIVGAWYPRVMNEVVDEEAVEFLVWYPRVADEEVDENAVQFVGVLVLRGG